MSAPRPQPKPVAPCFKDWTDAIANATPLIPDVAGIVTGYLDVAPVATKVELTVDMVNGPCFKPLNLLRASDMYRYKFQFQFVSNCKMHGSECTICDPGHVVIDMRRMDTGWIEPDTVLHADAMIYSKPNGPCLVDKPKHSFPMWDASCSRRLLVNQYASITDTDKLRVYRIAPYLHEPSSSRSLIRARDDVDPLLDAWILSRPPVQSNDRLRLFTSVKPVPELRRFIETLGFHLNSWREWRTRLALMKEHDIPIHQVARVDALIYLESVERQGWFVRQMKVLLEKERDDENVRQLAALYKFQLDRVIGRRVHGPSERASRTSAAER
jgi:hypothetical protein